MENNLGSIYDMLGDKSDSRVNVAMEDKNYKGFKVVSAEKNGDTYKLTVDNETQMIEFVSDSRYGVYEKFVNHIDSLEND